MHIFILTNGVEFSLIAGAIVIVNFTKSWTNNSSGNPNTLNINSTGAKNVLLNNSTVGSWRAETGIIQIRYAYPNAAPVLFCYTGSAYGIQMPLKFVYEDE